MAQWVRRIRITSAMLHLRSVSLSELAEGQAAAYPFSVPAVSALAGERLELDADITFLVGENGSGKSTFLEALACAAGSVAVGSESLERDPSLQAVRSLARRFKLVWSKRTHRGFFLRAEDFFGYAKRLQQMRAEAIAEIEAIEKDGSLSKYARGLASMPHARTLAELRERYGEDLDGSSHGESFITLFRSRFVPGGLYLLDEPEAPLSPKRQLGLIALIRQMVAEGDAQFIVATHSPILMALPEAAILSFDGGRIQRVAYDDLEHVTLTRDFLRRPESYLRHL